MWSNVGERTLKGPDFVKEAEEKVALIRKRLLEAQSRQKSYAYNRQRELRFEEGDFVYLKVSPMRGVKRFQMKGKLAPRFVGPYPVINQVGCNTQGVTQGVHPGLPLFNLLSHVDWFGQSTSNLEIQGPKQVPTILDIMP
jgi:hypothetical protein